MTTEETKTNIAQELSNDIFDLKEKLTDSEFKTIMEKLSKLNTEVKKRFYKITYLCTEFKPDCENYWDCDIYKRTKYLLIEKLPTGLVENLDHFVEKGDIFQKMSGYLSHELQDEYNYKIHADECDDEESKSKWISKNITVIKVEKE